MIYVNIAAFYFTNRRIKIQTVFSHPDKEDIAIMSSQKIETFIFVDMECSGFEADNKIAEIAFVAVHREAMNSTGKTPRVLDKLVICVDPEVEVFCYFCIFCFIIIQITLVIYRLVCKSN